MERNILAAADKARERIRGSNYAQSTVENYENSIRCFEDYASAKGADCLNVDLVESYAESLRAAGSEAAFFEKMRGVRVMCDEAGLATPAFESYGERASQRACEVPARFADDHAAFLSAKKADGVEAGTLKHIERYSRQFFVFLDSRIEDVDGLSIEDCDAFLADRAGDLEESTLTQCRSAVRQLVAFLMRHYALDGRLEAFVEEKHKTPPAKLQRFLTDEETKAMLDAAKATKVNPRRTLLIVAMLLQYMVRGIDLCKMTLDDIDWDNNRIVIRASKNGKARVFDLTESLRYIILDYLKNERPSGGPHRNLILAARYPHSPLESSTGPCKVLHRVAREAGVNIEGDRFGCHVMRRTGATALMESGVSYPVISDVLIHDVKGTAASDTAMVYLRFDMKRLRLAALEVKPRG